MTPRFAHTGSHRVHTWDEMPPHSPNYNPKTQVQNGEPGAPFVLFWLVK
jgi:hypothetical protein